MDNQHFIVHYGLRTTLRKNILYSQYNKARLTLAGTIFINALYAQNPKNYQLTNPRRTIKQVKPINSMFCHFYKHVLELLVPWKCLVSVFNHNGRNSRVIRILK